MLYYDIEKETMYMKFIYPAVFRKTENGYHAFFPDLECCEASGDTLDDAIENANEACRNWITVELEEDTPYKVIIDGVEAGEMKTNLGGKLSFSVELEQAEQVSVKIEKI